MDYLKIAIIALIVILIAKFVLNLDGKKIKALIINAVIGCLVIWLINWTGLVSIPLNIITSLVVGIFGLPGVIILVILVFCGII